MSNITLISLKNFFRSVLPPAITIRLMAFMHYQIGEPEIRILKSLVVPEKDSIDIGANKGIYSYFLAGLSHHVFAYEPNLELKEFLSKSVCSNVSLFPIALSNKKGKATLSIPIVNNFVADQLGTLKEQAPVEEVRTFEVLTKRLDDQGHTNVGFVKIDVEGHEESVIEGATELLKTQRPNLLIEIEQRHIDKDISEIFSKILALGYEGFFLLNGKLKTLDEFSQKKYQNRSNYVGLSSLGNTYVCNFIFKPKVTAQVGERREKHGRQKMIKSKV